MEDRVDPRTEQELRGYLSARLDRIPVRSTPRFTRSGAGWLSRAAPVPIMLVLLVIAVAGGVALGDWREQRSQAASGGEPSAAYAVAKVSEISATPKAIEVQLKLFRPDVPVFAPPACGPFGIGCPALELRPVTVFLVKDDSEKVHAYIGEDPRNGCALEWHPEFHNGVFYDVCHGSLYNRQGKVEGGPSPRSLHELAVEVRGDDVFIDPRRILIGAVNTPIVPASPATPRPTPSPSLIPGTLQNFALGYSVRPPDGYRRYATLVVPEPDGVGVDFFTLRTDAEERAMCVRTKGSDLGSREWNLDLQIRVVLNVGGTSAMEYASAPNRRIVFTTIQPTTVNGYEAVKVVHQQSGDTSRYVIRANNRIYEISPGADEQPSPLPKGWLDQIVSTFRATTPEPTPSAIDTRTRC